MKTPSKANNDFRPLTDDREILDFIHKLGGTPKDDLAVCREYGMNTFQASVLRRIFGKVKTPVIRHTDDVKQQVIDGYRAGRPMQDISKETGLSLGSMYSILDYAHVERDRHDFWTPIKIRKLIALREEKNMKWADIAMMFGRSYQVVAQKYTQVCTVRMVDDAAKLLSDRGIPAVRQKNLTFAKVCVPDTDFWLKIHAHKAETYSIELMAGAHGKTGTMKTGIMPDTLVKVVSDALSTRVFCEKKLYCNA